MQNSDHSRSDFRANLGVSHDSSETVESIAGLVLDAGRLHRRRCLIALCSFRSRVVVRWLQADGKTDGKADGYDDSPTENGDDYVTLTCSVG